VAAIATNQLQKSNNQLTATRNSSHSICEIGSNQLTASSRQAAWTAVMAVWETAQ